MQTIINGKHYKFLIELIEGNNYYFEIIAAYENSKQMSTITNLNYILSELLGEQAHFSNFEETTWEITERELALKIWATTNELFGYPAFVNTLEKHLDEDRILGGWDTIISL